MHTFKYDIDNLAKNLRIRQLGKKGGKKAVAELIDLLTDPSLNIVDAARDALFGLVPMASLTERWSDDSPVQITNNTKIPDWLKGLCDGWGEDGDFVDLCIQKVKNLDKERVDFYLDQMAAFQGAERLFIKRLKQYNMSEFEKSFKKKVKSLRNRQFPKQLSISPTMACQLTCSYCVSAGVEVNQRNELALNKALKILDWAEKCGVERIGFTGGEPTIYSHFSELLELISKRGFKVYLATNGLCSRKAVEAIIRSRPLCITMHLTPQVLVSNEMLQTYIQNAHLLVKEGAYVAMRCNFASPDENILPYFNVAAEANIREIRAAIPMPNAGRHNQYVEVANLRKGFYLIITPRYSSAQKLPIQLYSEKLFNYLSS